MASTVCTTRTSLSLKGPGSLYKAMPPDETQTRSNSTSGTHYVLLIRTEFKAVTVLLIPWIFFFCPAVNPAQLSTALECMKAFQLRSFHLLQENTRHYYDPFFTFWFCNAQQIWLRQSLLQKCFLFISKGNCHKTQGKSQQPVREINNDSIHEKPLFFCSSIHYAGTRVLLKLIFPNLISLPNPLPPLGVL